MSIFTKTREFLMDEKDVTTVLSVINRHRTGLDSIISVANCGWANEPTTWFVLFETSEKRYRKIVNDLKEIGELYVDVRPSGMTSIGFKRES